MSDKNCYVLAMYDVRGKQDYIYRRNRLKEIKGASLIIRDCFIDYLFPMAVRATNEKGIYSYQVNGPTTTEKDTYEYKNSDNEIESFSRDDVENKFSEGYIGYVVYDGGGNFFVLYKSLEIYKLVNKLFYTKLMMETGTLRVLTSYIEGINFDDYKNDERQLRALHRKAENEECDIYPVNSLPIVQTDYSSAMPLTDIVYLTDEGHKKPEKVCKESYAKYKKHDEYSTYNKDLDVALEDAGEKISEIKKFDDLVEKGIDSHIAVIYIDGNSMGAKVEACLNGKITYEECINELRKFSRDIQIDYIDKPRKAIEKVLKENTDEDKKQFRFIVSAGDEITVICNAKYAYKVVESYFNKLDDSKGQSSCAGVAIFHSHAPYSEAYRIAEECCESGKAWMKEKGIDTACFMDFHYCQGAIGTSLDKIRHHEGTVEMCKPWLIKGNIGVDKVSNENITKEDIDRMKKILSIIARSNNKTLLQVAKKSQELYVHEIERIFTHFRGAKEDKIYLDTNKEYIIQNRNLLYRMMLVYDLWFENILPANNTELGENK